MKFMITSDLHGSAYYTKKLLEAYKIEQPKKLLLLGDLLHHGPRNDPPKTTPQKKSLLCSIRCLSISCVSMVIVRLRSTKWYWSSR